MPWRHYISKNYGKSRLDICHLGLLWLELLEIDVKDIYNDEKMVFPKFISLVNSKISLKGLFPGGSDLIKKM